MACLLAQRHRNYEQCSRARKTVSRVVARPDQRNNPISKPREDACSESFELRFGEPCGRQSPELAQSFVSVRTMVPHRRRNWALRSLENFIAAGLMDGLPRVDDVFIYMNSVQG